MAEKVSNQSLLTWFLQRFSGLFLAIFLFTHIDVHHFLHRQGLINFAEVNERLAGSVGWKIFYIFFVPFCVFHALNGIWAILADYRPSGGFSASTKVVFWVVGLILTAIGALTLVNLFAVGV
jgi:succinate dehydrogenase hydrophobic anchor subunit